MTADLDELSGDVAGLIGYRRHANGMSYAPPRIGRACIVITCHAPGLVSLPAKFWPDIDELEPEPAPSCTTCGSTDPATIEGLPYCPNDFHYPTTESDWRRIAAYIAGIAIIGAWLLSLFLYAAGVIK